MQVKIIKIFRSMMLCTVFFFSGVVKSDDLDDLLAICRDFPPFSGTWDRIVEEYPVDAKFIKIKEREYERLISTADTKEKKDLANFNKNSEVNAMRNGRILSSELKASVFSLKNYSLTEGFQGEFSDFIVDYHMFGGIDMYRVNHSHRRITMAKNIEGENLGMTTRGAFPLFEIPASFQTM